MLCETRMDFKSKKYININIPNLSSVIVFIDNCMGQRLQSEFKISNSSWLLIQVQMCSPYDPVRKRPFWPHMLTSGEKMRAPPQEWTPRVWGDSISFYKKEKKKKTKPYCLKCFNNSIETSKVSHFFPCFKKECRQGHTEAAGDASIWGVRRGLAFRLFWSLRTSAALIHNSKEKSQLMGIDLSGTQYSLAML